MKYISLFFILICCLSCSKEYCSQYTGDWDFEITQDGYGASAGSGVPFIFNEIGAIECGSDDEIRFTCCTNVVHVATVDEDGNIGGSGITGNFNGTKNFTIHVRSGGLGGGVYKDIVGVKRK